MIYPEDANGIVLRRIAAQGKDLTKARNIDFTIVFAQGKSAEQFAEHSRELGYAVSVEETEPERDFPWNVIVVKHMVPTYEGITDFENELQSVADRWEGRNDVGAFSPKGLQINNGRELAKINIKGSIISWKEPRKAVDSPFELHFTFCFQQSIYPRVGVWLRVHRQRAARMAWDTLGFKSCKCFGILIDVWGEGRPTSIPHGNLLCHQ
jgi:hypothetical protein